MEKIQQMKSEGKSDQQILQELQAQGISPQQAYESLSQATIKQAVTTQPESEFQSSALQPSMLASEEQMPSPNQSTQDTQYMQPSEYSYPEQYQEAYAPSFSADTIAEISEQVISEKFSSLREQLEKIIDFRTSTSAKINALDERLQRIEKIIDRLQLSILQKVGEQLTNIEDIKNELIETQKSFKSVISERHQKVSKPMKEE